MISSDLCAGCEALPGALELSAPERHGNLLLNYAPLRLQYSKPRVRPIQWDPTRVLDGLSLARPRVPRENEDKLALAYLEANIAWDSVRRHGGPADDSATGSVIPPTTAVSTRR